MLRSGNALRITAPEVEEFRALGLELDGVKSTADFAEALAPWLDALGEVRPDLLERMARDLAEAKDLRLPQRLTAVPSSDSPD